MRGHPDQEHQQQQRHRLLGRRLQGFELLKPHIVVTLKGDRLTPHIKVTGFTSEISGGKT